MNEKEVREAIELLKNEIDIVKTVNAPGLQKHAKRNAELYSISIEALEKQLPRKSIKKKITDGTNKSLHEFYCPVCTGNGDWSNKCNVGKYCSDCGQKLDWSEEDEI